MAAGEPSGKAAPRSYHNCVVLGCLNTTSNSQYTFFSLPLDGERRSSWLRLIQREDLLARSAQHCRVCEQHFPARSVLASPSRKVLRKDSLPRLRLPERSRLSKATQTLPAAAPAAPVYSACTGSQTPKYLMRPRKALRGAGRLGRGSRFRPAPPGAARARFLALCSRLLGPRLCARVRAHAAPRPPAPDSSSDDELLAKYTNAEEEELLLDAPPPARDPLRPDAAPPPPPRPLPVAEDKLVPLAPVVKIEAEEGTPVVKIERKVTAGDMAPRGIKTKVMKIDPEEEEYDSDD